MSSEPIPPWLYAPVSREHRPPVTTQIQVLPFIELDAADFERLCVALAREDGEPEACRLYGVRGQAQSGIDIYARLPSGRYATYQCKRYVEVTDADIRNAVNEFRAGDWLSRSERFVFCTSRTTARTDHENEIEAQVKVLAEDGVAFEVWDAEELSTRLKERPRVVLDFFGRDWVTAFCTEPLRDEHRLDAAEVARLRAKLRDFYARLFLRQDLLAENRDGELRPVVMPDVLRTRHLAEAGERGPNHATEGGMGDRDERPPTSLTQAPDALLSDRVPALDWIGAQQRCLLLGGAGSGKSTLIRWLCLELLAEEPGTVGPQSSEGAFVAVWLPFGRWVAAIATDDRETSLPGALERFFSAYAADDLWTLVEAGLGDDRLVLIVDGLDEWSDETAAAIAAERLQQYLFQRGLPAVAASREEGLRAFGLLDPEWSTTQLAPLSRGQQEQFLLTLDASPAQAQALLSDVTASPRLRRLGENPLLLGLLWRLRADGIALPPGAQAVLARFIRWLIETQAPARRRNAQATNPLELDADEVEGALGALALAMQNSSSPGVPIGDARAAITSFLTEATPNRLEATQARTQARLLIDEACGPIGAMSRLDGNHVIFNHRALQEHLAGGAIARLDPAQQDAAVRQHTNDQSWSNVLEALIWSAAPADQANALMQRLLDVATSGPPPWNAMPTIAQVALSENDLTDEIREGALRAVCEFVASGDRVSARSAALDALLEGVDDNNLLAGAVAGWWPSRIEDRSFALSATGDWPDEHATLGVWWAALGDENTATARSAGALLVERFAGDDGAAEHLAALLRRPLTHTARAVMLDTLSRGWPDHPEIGRWTTRAIGSPDPTIRLVAVNHLVRNRLQDDTHLEVALKLADGWIHVDQGFSRELPQVIVDGWPGHDRVRDLVIETLNDTGRPARPLDFRLALTIAVSALSADRDVAAWIRHSVHQPRPLLLLAPEAWRMVGEQYRETDLLPDLEALFLLDNVALEVNLYQLALGLRTERARDYLIDALTKTNGFPTAGWPFGHLVLGWPDDERAQEVLRQFARSGDQRVAQVTHWLDDVLPQAEAAALLLDLARDPANDRAGEALAALGNRDDLALRRQAFEIGFARRDDRPALGVWVADVLLAQLGEDPRAIDIALERLGAPDAGQSLWAIARAGQHHAAVRHAVRNVLLPLPVELRRRLAQRLFEMRGTGSAEVTQWRLESDGLAASAAASAHARAVAADQRAAAVSQAVDALQARKLDFEGQSQAGLCALLELGAVDAFAAQNFTFDPTRPLWVEFGVFHLNWWMGARVARHFPAIQAVLGDQLLERFNAQNYPHAFWGTLAPFASEPGLLQDAVLEFIRESGAGSNPQLLRFLAAVRPSSQELSTVLLSTARGTVQDRSEARTALLLSAQLLAQHFENDADVLARLLADHPASEGELLALAMGWRRSPAAVERLNEMFAARMRFSPDVGVRLSLLGASPEHALAALCSWFPEGEGEDWLVAPPTTAAMIRTVLDPEFAGALKARVLENRTPSELGSGSKLLAAAGRMDAQLRAFLEQRAEDALTGTDTDAIGLDIFAEALQPLGWMLWDSLHGVRAVAGRG